MVRIIKGEKFFRSQKFKKKSSAKSAARVARSSGTRKVRIIKEGRKYGLFVGPRRKR